jgi:hypothetical protein
VTTSPALRGWVESLKVATNFDIHCLVTSDFFHDLRIT